MGDQLSCPLSAPLLDISGHCGRPIRGAPSWWRPAEFRSPAPTSGPRGLKCVSLPAGIYGGGGGSSAFGFLSGPHVTGKLGAFA